MNRLKTVLKDRSGQGTPMILAVVVCCLILACVVFEYMRLVIGAQGVRDSVQSAIVAVATENWDEAYPGLREGYSGGYQLSGNHYVKDGISYSVAYMNGVEPGTYTVVEETLHLRLEAYADAATIVNLTNHAYWNLSGKPTIDSMTLEVRASAYTPVDATNIPDGRILPVEGTDFDLRKAALLGERNSAAHPDTAAGLDHNYVLDSEPGDKIAAILLDPESRHRLIVATDAPGLQVYTGEYLPQARQGIALEAQGFPNAVNTPHFPSVILRPGQSATRSITWTVR